ncbi:MAG: Holliday junction resolvase-like protein [Spirochaetia bacterium]|nr:endonuclease [Spirochaetota bacterium]MCX8096312.1 endonuclease [Spirochaetota bacterium]MDW8112327.1 Holliday junction resolvase-like protein [Spirochaetia bacterium]
MTTEIILTFVVYGVLTFLFGVVLGYFIARIVFNRELDKIIREERKSALSSSRSVLKGKITEQLLPLMPFFNYNLSDARFIGSPIDYIVFDGYSDLNVVQDEIKEIVFIEVKSGNSPLSVTESAIKRAVDEKRVRFEVLHINKLQKDKVSKLDDSKIL